MIALFYDPDEEETQDWPSVYHQIKAEAEAEARAELVRTLMALAMKPGETREMIPVFTPIGELL